MFLLLPYRITNNLSKYYSKIQYNYFHHNNFILSRKPTFKIPEIPNYLNILTPSSAEFDRKLGTAKLSQIIFGLL